MLTFFGLTPRHKLVIHNEIFNMVTYGKGGWTWHDLYTMPVFLRTYYMKQMAENLRKESTPIPTGPQLGKQQAPMRPPVAPKTRSK